MISTLGRRVRENAESALRVAYRLNGIPAPDKKVIAGLSTLRLWELAEAWMARAAGEKVVERPDGLKPEPRDQWGEADTLEFISDPTAALERFVKRHGVRRNEDAPATVDQEN